MARLVALALVLVAFIAAMLAVQGLPWAAQPGLTASPPGRTDPPAQGGESGDMADLTRHVLRGIARTERPDPLALAVRQSMTAEAPDAYVRALQSEAGTMATRSAPAPGTLEQRLSDLAMRSQALQRGTIRPAMRPERVEVSPSAP